jgi:hypothetical protein
LWAAQRPDAPALSALIARAIAAQFWNLSPGHYQKCRRRPGVVRTHYANVTSPAVAAAWWNVTPEQSKPARAIPFDKAGMRDAATRYGKNPPSRKTRVAS